MKKKILLILSAVLIFASCEDFLNELPEHEWSVDASVSSYDDVKKAVTGIYATVMKGDAIGTEMVGRLNVRLGLLFSSTFTYDQTLSNTPANSPTTLWSTLYKGINQANFALESMSKLSDDIYPSPEAKNEIMGEVRFLRGWFHSLAMLNYCYWWSKNDSSPYGVIYRDKMAVPDNVYAPRLTVGESWKKIFDDIDFGIENMSSTFTTSHRVSLIYAKAWKAKLLMIRGKYGDAMELIGDCLNALPAAGIAMQADMAQHFEQAWDSKENIFVRYLDDDGNRTANAGSTTTNGASIFGTVANTAADGSYYPSLKEATAALFFGHSWMSEDPRWPINVGYSRDPAAAGTTNYWSWTKIFRRGTYAGQYGTPKDEKYALYFMRVPELYIMKAECLAHNGASYADVIAPINQMRAQRTNPVLDPLPVPADKQEMWDAIFHEYANELILENGCVYFAAMRIPHYGVSYYESIRSSQSLLVDSTKIQLPIPQAEIINNKALEGMQNPGQE